MSKLIMIINKFGRFVGKEPSEKGNSKSITLWNAIQIIEMMNAQGPQISGSILGDLKTVHQDIRIELDSKSTYQEVYHQCMSNIVLAKEPSKSIITGK